MEVWRRCVERQRLPPPGKSEIKLCFGFSSRRLQRTKWVSCCYTPLSADSPSQAWLIWLIAGDKVRARSFYRRTKNCALTGDRFRNVVHETEVSGEFPSVWARRENPSSRLVFPFCKLITAEKQNKTHPPNRATFEVCAHQNYRNVFSQGGARPIVLCCCEDMY